jgi:hypothetical protein
MKAPGSSRVAGCRGDQPLLVLPTPHERGVRRALVLHALPPPPDGVRPVMVMAHGCLIEAPWLANGGHGASFSRAAWHGTAWLSTPPGPCPPPLNLRWQPPTGHRRFTHTFQYTGAGGDHGIAKM